jgi:heme o synthase
LVSFRNFLIMIRFRVSLAVSFSAITASIVFQGIPSLNLIWSGIGIFLLASGASALNQYQEWPYDEKMKRTMSRPLPSRHVSTAQALQIAGMLIIGGSLILLYKSTASCFLLGLFNIIWYNGVYTYLKRRTAFAVVPGALTGSIPVFMGWAAAGGKITDPEVLFIAFFIFIWQMPHFWLLIMKYGSEYKDAGFPVLSSIFNPLQMKILVMVWMVAAAITSMMFGHFNIIHYFGLVYSIILLNIGFLLFTFYQLFIRPVINYRQIFFIANSFMLLVMIALITDHLVIKLS